MPSLPILVDRGPAPRPKPTSRLHRVAVRLFRAAALLAAAGLIHLAFARTIPEETPRITLAQARLIFPWAERIGTHDRARNSYGVIDASGETLGQVLTTSPETDGLIGYSGPSNLLVGLDAEGRIAGVRLLTSGDTPAHVGEVQKKASFWSGFVGWSPAEPTPPKVDAVAGSTLTALTMAEAVQQRLSGQHVSLRFPEPLTMEELLGCFASAAKIDAGDPRPGWYRVRDAGGQTLGFALRTSPASDDLMGYAGPAESLVAIAPDEKTIVAVRLRKSYDTREYVDRVRDDEDYLNLPKGKTIDQWAAVDFKQSGIEGVSGATQTSYAVLEGVRRRMAAEAAAAQTPVPAPTSLWKPRDLGLLLVVLGALAMAFTRLMGKGWLRVAWQIVLVAGFGLWFGDLLSLAMLAGWSRHGVPWRSSPVLVLLVVVALAIPWGTKQQIYCHQLCPHGVLQEWLGRVKRWRVALPPVLSRLLGYLPNVLLLAALVLSLTLVTFDLSQLEPFDAWILKQAAVVSSVIAVVGLVVSLFIPQAYCRFGCPTGALLKLIRSHGAGDHFGLGDGVILAALAGGAAFLGLTAPVGSSPTEPKNTEVATTLAGEAFGTTWSVKLRQSPKDAKQLRDALAAELERIESKLSHWRGTSETSQFNASTTTFPMEFSPELFALVVQAQDLSVSTQGAFDITVAPLVDLWGYGPSGPRANPPTDAEIAAVLERVGYEKLGYDIRDKSLRKKHPELKLDLGALLQGYSADQLAELLEKQQAGDCLIDVGGELRARGEWTVAIENPAAPGVPLGSFTLRDASLATSGVYRKSKDGPSEARHILSPKTGRPVEATWKLCAVLRTSCQEADVWATALLAVASERSLEIADREKVAVLLIDAAGVRKTSAAWREVVDAPR